MKSGKDVSDDNRAMLMAGRQLWSQTRKRTWEQDSFNALAARHASLLGGLFSETSVNCLRRIAENSSVPARMLEQLAVHPEASVREAVSDNPNTPLDTLWVLSTDECVDVRFAMAENHNLPLAVLSVLVEDENPYVACRASSTIERLIGGTLFEPAVWNKKKKDIAKERAAG